MMKYLIAAFVFCFATPAIAVTPVCGTADDTAAVQAAINTGVVDLPKGFCAVSRLDGTRRHGLIIKGQGSGQSFLLPIKSGANVLDLTGAGNVTLQDFRIAGMNNPSVIPQTGILSAQPNNGYSSDVTTIMRVRVDGNFSLAAWYNLQVASSSAVASQFYNYKPGAITVVFTGNNFFGASSAFAPINNANDGVPSDWTLTQVEIHNFGNASALWLGGVSGLRMFGGNISSNSFMVDVNAVIAAGVQVAPDNMMFVGTTFYTDSPPPLPPCAARNGARFGVIFSGNYTIVPLTC